MKLTKTELRIQQRRLAQLQKYLPTLQLKKALLQAEVNEARIEIVQLEENYKRLHTHVESYAELLTEKIDFDGITKVKEIKRRFENIAGVEVPYFEKLAFEEFTYSFFDTPIWFEGVMTGLRSLVEARVRVRIAEEKKAALEHELRQVSIRVNLFEKILIPRAIKNVKAIRVFLGDQELAAVGRAKVAKAKLCALM